MHEDYLSKETGKKKGLRDLDLAGVQNKTERRMQACTGETRVSSRKEVADRRRGLQWLGWHPSKLKFTVLLP